MEIGPKATSYNYIYTYKTTNKHIVTVLKADCVMRLVKYMWRETTREGTMEMQQL